jgi:hypothetical protein
MYTLTIKIPATSLTLIREFSDFTLAADHVYETYGAQYVHLAEFTDRVEYSIAASNGRRELEVVATIKPTHPARPR